MPGTACHIGEGAAGLFAIAWRQVYFKVVILVAQRTVVMPGPNRDRNARICLALKREREQWLRIQIAKGYRRCTVLPHESVAR